MSNSGQENVRPGGRKWYDDDYGGENSGRENFRQQYSGQKNPVQNSGQEKNRSRLYRTLFWDALGTIVWLLVVVWLVWAGSPIVVTGNDAVVLTALVISVVGTKTYFRWRNIK